MKNLILFMIVCSTSLYASVNVDFIGICQETPLLSDSAALKEEMNLGQATVEVLRENNVNFQGNEKGINTAFGSPFGDDSIIIVSDTEMKAYGWCFSINGMVPEVFANEVALENGDNIVWFYAFAHYKDGEWIAQCSPSWKNPLPKWCD